MTDPTPRPHLSPAAQAVLDAYGDFEAANVDAMAAALRAAADWECRPSDWKPPFGSDEIDAAEWWLEGYEAAVEEIKARFDLIADELEGTP